MQLPDEAKTYHTEFLKRCQAKEKVFRELFRLPPLYVLCKPLLILQVWFRFWGICYLLSTLVTWHDWSDPSARH